MFNFKEENKHDTDFSMPSIDEMKELTDLMEECGLTDSALYKSYTVDTTVSEVSPPPKEIPIPDDFITKMFTDPVPVTNPETVESVLKKLKGYYDELAQNVKTFYDKNIDLNEDISLQRFQESLDQSECDEWYKYRKFKCTSSKIREINYARNPRTRYAAFTGFVFVIFQSFSVSAVKVKEL